ncbi:helix-turn-helix domain-containing protein [Amycolatopsis sp. NPDC051045]|uniref:helix-turn-helix transcriptional regulator n=1 Tax=Amycolatopsis sp. NPDC051045 TaxID=3156922 RepID=UPI00342C5FBC
MAQQRTLPGSRQLLKISDVCEELAVAESTFYDWRAKNRGPRCIKLPNGGVRIRRADFETWLETREEAA